jgi:hypothetical protein
MPSAKKLLLFLFLALLGYLYREYHSGRSGKNGSFGRVPPFRRFVNLWEEKSTHVSMIVCMFLMAFLLLSSIIKVVFDDIREIERIVNIT